MIASVLAALDGNQEPADGSDPESKAGDNQGSDQVTPYAVVSMESKKEPPKPQSKDQVTSYAVVSMEPEKEALE